VKRSAGFSLVEVLVASAVMVAVFVPLMFVFTQSVRQAEVSLDELEATLLADEMADQMQIVPVVRQFQSLIPYPVPNPPPAYSQWATYPTTGIDFRLYDAAVSGGTVNAAAGGRAVSWAGEDMPVSERPYTRMYLTPTAPRFKRFLKVHGALDRSASMEENPHLMEVEVKVTWDDNFVSGPKTAREVVVRGLVADPRPQRMGP
jgi:type II secretory pathway pseudopilin PulG